MLCFVLEQLKLKNLNFDNAVSALKWIFFHEVIQIIATSFIFALYLEQVKKTLSPILKIERSMGVMYGFSFSKSRQTQVTWVAMVTPNIYIPFISPLKLLYLPTPINRPEFLMSTSFKAIGACLGSKL